MRLFVATSFSSKVDLKTGQVLPEFRQELESVLHTLRKLKNLEVFCAIEHESWVASDDSPEVGVEKDLNEIDNCHALLAFLHDQPSAGVQYEMGYASGQGKTVILATRDKTTLSYFNQGLVNLNIAHHLLYSDPAILARQLEGVLHE